MTQIADKLQPLLRKRSGYERIWMYLKDHPNKTLEEVAAALSMKMNTVSAAFHDMFAQRGMLKRQRGSRMGRGVWEYTALGGTYELLPRKAKVKASPAPAPVQLAPDAAPAPRPAFDIEAYTLGELRAIHAQLDKLFR